MKRLLLSFQTNAFEKKEKQRKEIIMSWKILQIPDFVILAFLCYQITLVSLPYFKTIFRATERFIVIKAFLQKILKYQAFSNYRT